MKRIIAIILLLSLVKIGQPQSQTLYSDPVSIQNAHSITEKWNFLPEAAKGARIIALGESLHGVKEYNAYKLEIIKYLHERMGFNVIAIESDLAMNFFGNAHKNRISDRLLLEKLFTPVWHTEHHLKLAKYVKQNPKLKIIGFDIVDINSINTALIDLSLKNIDSTKNERKILAHYAEIKARYKNEEHFYNGVRDSIMANNVIWILKELYPEEKIIISAANDHISKIKTSKHGYMGALLAKEFKDVYFSIGFFHSLGDPTHIYRDFYYQNEASELPEQSIQAKLLNQKNNSLFIHLKELRRKKKYRWVDHEVPNVFKTGEYEYSINLSKSFDALIWIKHVTHPNYVIESKYHHLNKD